MFQIPISHHTYATHTHTHLEFKDCQSTRACVCTQTICLYDFVCNVQLIPSGGSEDGLATSLMFCYGIGRHFPGSQILDSVV